MSQIAPAFGQPGGGQQVLVEDGTGKTLTADELLDADVSAKVEW